MSEGTALQWPALHLNGAKLPERLAYERGIWGKVHGAPSDYRWIATTPAFAGKRRAMERELTFGVEDAPVPFTAWRILGTTGYAVSAYPSAAKDAAERTGFLEKQIIEWERTPDVPALLGALLLLPVVASFDASSHWSRHGDARWSEPEFSIDLDPDSHPPLTVQSLETTIAAGLRMLTAAVTQESLAELYGALLAGGRGLQLRGVTGPLRPEVLAVLLLPLPRAIADEISMSAWLPASRLTDVEDLQRRWNVIAGPATPSAATHAVPDADQMATARLMAGCIFSGDPSPLGVSEVSGEADPSISLTLWGPSAVGKTVLLANLYLETEDEDWDVFPTEKSAGFVEAMRNRMRTSNLFPIATPVGHLDRIEYLFVHRRSGMSASLALEDRAGVESEDLLKYRGDASSLHKRLATADGLVLLFDPIRDQATLEAHVWRTLELVHVASRRGVQKDHRPIAVCVSKADVLIETADDFRCARDTPDEFVRDRIPAAIVRVLERFCSDFKLFPVSAAGVRLRYGVIEPAVFFDENLEPRICPGGRAFNLMTPFAWILNRLTESRS
ncbi:MAG: TRAFAC clade GTPase domain-containing protein [Thermoanaerobaculia bacterium]